MKSLTLEIILKETGGKALTRFSSHGPQATAVCHDTRQLASGCLFVAIKGDRFNGNTFLPDAASKGAIAALVEDIPEKTLPNVHLIQVQNTRKAMGKLARYVREKILGKVIAVGGSNGKTSTKYLIDAVLHHKRKGSMSPKSFNNDIGVPMTIFAADPSQEYLVLEIGTNHPGEVRVLTDIARPDIAVITNIGAEHLEGFGDLMGVRREEASIIEGLNPKGLLVVNGDDKELLEAVSAYRGKKFTFGFNTSNDLFATDIRCEMSGTRFKLNNRQEVFVPMLGRHTACNALAAIAVGRNMNLKEAEIIESLAIAEGPDMRLQLMETNGVTILNDAYNANPHSMKAALDTLATLPTRARRIAVLGDMRELGESTERYHREIGAYAAGKGLDLLACVGEQSRLMAEAAQAAGMSAKDIKHYPDSATAARKIPGCLDKGDLVLVKGSRGMRMETVAEAIGAAHTPLRKVAS